jgi:hypothetical protein
MKRLDVPVPLGRVANAFFFALWVAVCAAAPEFLWQGLLSLFSHFSLTDAAAALLIGAILAFFVEPVLERLRSLDAHHEREPKTPAFAACVALSFAVVAVCVHEAITVYVAASHANEQARENLVTAVSLALQWAVTPFFVALAWIAARESKWLAWTAAGVAVIAGLVIGLLFGWQPRVLATSAIPSICILVAGCLIVREQWNEATFRRCARATAVIALTWLVVTGVLQLLLWIANVQAFRIYESAEFWSDLRFYFGWVIGLFVAPPPVAGTLLDDSETRRARR